MERLIDADALLEHLARCIEQSKGLMRSVCVAIKCFVEQTPTVDAVPVVHGIWLVDDYDSGDPGYYSAYIEVHCSECGYELGAESGQYGWAYGDPFPLNYCPNCGARMNLKEESDA